MLERKREITRFQILVEVAASHSQIKQSQIASSLGITPQAVSEYTKELVAEGMITSGGRGQYTVTPLGVESIINGANELKDYSDYVLKNVIGQVSVWAAIAGETIKKNDVVYLTMKDGILCAGLEPTDGAYGIATNDAKKWQDVGVANLKGLIPLNKEPLAVIRVPSIAEGGSHAVNPETLRYMEGIVGFVGLEAMASIKAAGREPDVVFGAADALIEASIKGVKGTLVVSMDSYPQVIQKLEASGVSYRVIDCLKK